MKDLEIICKVHEETTSVSTPHLPTLPAQQTYGLVLVNEDGTIDVNVKRAEIMNVRIWDIIEGIDRALPVKIKE